MATITIQTDSTDPHDKWVLWGALHGRRLLDIVEEWHQMEKHQDDSSQDARQRLATTLAEEEIPMFVEVPW